MTLSIENQRRKALANYLEITLTEATDLIDGGEYSVLLESEVLEAVGYEIRELLCYFSYEFLANHSSAINALGKDLWLTLVQSGDDDKLNNFILDNVDFDYFVDDAISCNGAGYFLNTYDGSEIETYYECSCNLDYDFYIYRRGYRRG